MLYKSVILIIVMAACAANCGAERTVDIVLKPTNASSETNTKPLAASELKALRREVAQKKRRIVFHSDGMSMNEEHRYLEKNPCVFPYIPGSQTDACTYSLIHQFPVARLYSSNILPRKTPWSPDSYIDVGRGKFETNWSVNIPVRGKAMVLANETLFVCGQPDIFDPKDPYAAIDGKMGSVLIAVSAKNGDILAEYKIESIPVFDSLIAANNSLYLTTEDGKVHCCK